MSFAGPDVRWVKVRWLPLLGLTSIVLLGACFLLSAFVIETKVKLNRDLPAIPLELMIVFFHFLPLLGSNETIRQFVLERDNQETRAVWTLWRTYIALDAVELGLTLLIRSH